MAAPEGFTLLPYTDTEDPDHPETPVYVTTLPKGTLLYRGAKALDTIYRDLYGVLKKDGTYCLPPEYNVFFYPFPFADDTVSIGYSHMLAYVTMRDIKLATFLSPSPMVRGDRHQDYGPITSCNKIPDHGCGLEGRDYDPCFKPDFRAAHPDVSGMIGIAEMDRVTFLGMVQNYKKSTPLRDYLNQYVSAYTDETRRPGVPEIILHPLATRGDSDSLTSKDTTIETWYEDHADTASYHLWHVVNRTNEDILAFMKVITGPGLNGTRVKLDTRTGFYVCEEDADEETKKHLVDIQGEGGEWAMSKEMPGFRFRRGKIEFPTLTEETYKAKVAELSEKVAAAFREVKPDTKYANRLAHGLSEAILRMMVVALGYYSKFDDFGLEEVPHDPVCRTLMKECAQVLDTALEEIAREEEEDEKEALGQTKDFKKGEPYPIDNASPRERGIFEKWRKLIDYSLMNVSFDPKTGIYDRAKMIDSAAQLASRLLRDTMDFAFTTTSAKDGPLQASHVVTEGVREVESLLTDWNDYGEEGWVNLAFDHHYVDGRWGDWSDEADESEEEEGEEEEGEEEEGEEEEGEEKEVKPEEGWGGEEPPPTGARRRRTYRARKTSLRRRR